MCTADVAKEEPAQSSVVTWHDIDLPQEMM